MDDAGSSEIDAGVRGVMFVIAQAELGESCVLRMLAARLSYCTVVQCSKVRHETTTSFDMSEIAVLSLRTRTSATDMSHMI